MRIFGYTPETEHLARYPPPKGGVTAKRCPETGKPLRKRTAMTQVTNGVDIGGNTTVVKLAEKDVQEIIHRINELKLPGDDPDYELPPRKYQTLPQLPPGASGQFETELASGQMIGELVDFTRSAVYRKESKVPPFRCTRRQAIEAMSKNKGDVYESIYNLIEERFVPMKHRSLPSTMGIDTDYVPPEFRPKKKILWVLNGRRVTSQATLQKKIAEMTPKK